MDKLELQKEHTDVSIMFGVIDNIKKDIIEQLDSLQIIVLRRVEELELLLNKEKEWK